MFNYITPEEAYKMEQESKHEGIRQLSLERLTKLAKEADKNKMCQCGQNPIWQYGECGLCFTCTTGEWDNSDDYELTMKGSK